jgi:hypothetical protein
VCGGPWEDMRRIFEEIGYSADYMRLDTKRYYIPQVPSVFHAECVSVSCTQSAPPARRGTGVGADECA